jgi:hypothetical protein
MSNILTGILNEANPYRISEPEREYGAPVQSRPQFRPQEPEDMPDDLPPEDPFKQDPSKLAKVDFSKAEGEAPNGKRYNMIMTVTGPSNSVRGEIDMFNKHNWGAKKIVDTTEIEAKTPNGPSQYTVYIVDNHKYGLWTPFKGEKPIGEPLVFRESQDGISASDLADILYNRLEMRYPDIVSRYGHEVVGDVVMDVADFHEGAEELGTSDIGGMIRQIVSKLENYNVDESKEQDYGPEYQAMVNRVGQLAKQGERKTVWDPVKKVYKTVPVNSTKDRKVPEQEIPNGANPSIDPTEPAELKAGDIIGYRYPGAKMVPTKVKILKLLRDGRAMVLSYSKRTIAAHDGNPVMTIGPLSSLEIQNPYVELQKKPNIGNTIGSQNGNMVMKEDAEDWLVPYNALLKNNGEPNRVAIQTAGLNWKKSMALAAKEAGLLGVQELLNFVADYTGDNREGMYGYNTVLSDTRTKFANEISRLIPQTPTMAEMRKAVQQQTSNAHQQIINTINQQLDLENAPLQHELSVQALLNKAELDKADQKALLELEMNARLAILKIKQDLELDAKERLTQIEREIEDRNERKEVRAHELELAQAGYKHEINVISITAEGEYKKAKLEADYQIQIKQLDNIDNAGERQNRLDQINAEKAKQLALIDSETKAKINIMQKEVDVEQQQSDIKIEHAYMMTFKDIWGNLLQKASETGKTLSQNISAVMGVLGRLAKPIMPKPQKMDEEAVATQYIQVKQLVDKMDKGGKKRIANALSKNLGITMQGVTETKNLGKKVKIVKGPDAGKIGYIRQIDHGQYKGAKKHYDVDIEGGGQANRLTSQELRLVKDEQSMLESPDKLPRPDNWKPPVPNSGTRPVPQKQMEVGDIIGFTPQKHDYTSSGKVFKAEVLEIGGRLGRSGLLLKLLNPEDIATNGGKPTMQISSHFANIQNPYVEKKTQQGVAEEFELAGVGVAYELGRKAYKQGMTIRDNPYSATKEARKYDEWEKGLERGKYDAIDAKRFRSSIKETQAHTGAFLLTESRTYKLWESAGQKIVEAQLTTDQINQIFKQVEQGATAAGGNRTMLGKGKDAAGAVKKAYDDLVSKVQNSGPIKGVDAMYDNAAEKLKQATGGDQGVMKYVQKYRDFAKEHPVAQSLIYSALIAAAGISGAGIGGAAALGLFKMVDKLLQGEKFSTAVGKGATTGAMAYGASQLGDYIKGGDQAASGGEVPADMQQGLAADQAFQDKLLNKFPPDQGYTFAAGEGGKSVQVLNSAGEKVFTGDIPLKTMDTQTFADLSNAGKMATPGISSGSISSDPMAGVSNAGSSVTNTASGTLSGVTGEQMASHPAYQAMIQKFGNTPGARQAAMAAAKAAILRGQANESIDLTESQIFLMIGKIVERQRKLDEGIMDTVKGAAGKAVDWAQTKGTNLTTKVTADKLLQAWKKAGSPTDSLDVASIIQKAGVPSASIKQVYSTMKIPFAGEPSANSASRNIDVDPSLKSAPITPTTPTTPTTTTATTTPTTPTTSTTPTTTTATTAGATKNIDTTYAQVRKLIDQLDNRGKQRVAQALKKTLGVTEEQLDELKCWSGFHRVAGTKAGFPGSCAKNKTNEEGVAEGLDGQVVFSGTGANGVKYEIIQSGDDFMIHANGRHIDSYGSLQRAMGVLKNEVPGLTKGVAEGSGESVSFREMVNVVDEHYPKYYAELSGSDISDEQFKQEIISTYNEITNKQGVAEEKCPHCSGPMFSELMINEKKDACYYKVKSRYKVWPSAYASGALVKCRNKGASNWGNSTKNEGSILEGINRADESLHDWFNKEKWVRMDTKGNIKGPCAKEPGEGKPKCLPQSKAYSLGKKGRASAAQRKRREDPNPDRSGKAINVNTKKKTKG